MCVAKTCAVPFPCTCVVYVRLFIIWKTWKLRKLRRRRMCYFVLPYLHIFFTFWLFQLRICTHSFFFILGKFMPLLVYDMTCFSRSSCLFLFLLYCSYIHFMYTNYAFLSSFHFLLLFLPLQMHFSQLFYCL